MCHLFVCVCVIFQFISEIIEDKCENNYTVTMVIRLTLTAVQIEVIVFMTTVYEIRRRNSN